MDDICSSDVPCLGGLEASNGAKRAMLLPHHVHFFIIITSTIATTTTTTTTAPTVEDRTAEEIASLEWAQTGY
ncbi:hypothetical protein VTH06DRAFT_7788 [Thermothelomyces fergusii]